MAVDLADYVESLKREVQPPGTNLFPGVTNATWAEYLIDAFWESFLDGFHQEWAIDPDTDEVVPRIASGPEFPRENVALVILYAGVRVLRNRLLNLNTQFSAKAGPVEYEVQNSATVLAEMLKQLAALKERLLDQLNADDGVTPAILIDAYTVRQLSPGSYGGYWGQIFAELPVGV